MNWQPIETAPKDQLILLFRPSAPQAWLRVGVGRFDDDRYAKRVKPFWGNWLKIGGVAESREHAPTHWMPPPRATPMTAPALRPRILAALALGFPLSIPDLEAMLWANRRALVRELGYLVGDGLVVRDGLQKRAGGHKARLWTISPAERVPVDYLKTLSTEEKQSWQQNLK